MEMHNPAHPGEIIREDCLVPLGVTVAAAAKGLGVSRQSLTKLLSGRTGVSAEMAIRLEKAGWSRAGAWLRVQSQYDLWQARQKEGDIAVERFIARGA
jgi:addiction module HigA family antidote